MKERKLPNFLGNLQIVNFIPAKDEKKLSPCTPTCLEEIIIMVHLNRSSFERVGKGSKGKRLPLVGARMQEVDQQITAKRIARLLFGQ